MSFPTKLYKTTYDTIDGCLEKGLSSLSKIEKIIKPLEGKKKRFNKTRGSLYDLEYINSIRREQGENNKNYSEDTSNRSLYNLNKIRVIRRNHS